jgi:hypothetical protein
MVHAGTQYQWQDVRIRSLVPSWSLTCDLHSAYAAICGLGPSDVVPGTIHFTEDGGPAATAREHADAQFIRDVHSGKTGSISVDCIPIQSIFDMTGVQVSGDVHC